MTIVGNGTFREILVSLVQDLRIDELVEFRDFVSRDELLNLYRSMDCFMFPSLHDSSGNVVLEAMSRGVPVVCLNLGGPPTFVDSTCGRVVSVAGRDERRVVEGLADAVLELASSPSLLEDLSKGALLRATNLNWKAQVERSYEQIRRVL
jgi:glycosyltransferase involved in cell wall biosynthesis